jgi:hypothetical protein
MTELLAPQTVHDLMIEIEQGGDLQILLGIEATQLGITGPPVVRNTAYAVGDRVTPASPNGFAYECTTAGTSHATTEPTWPLIVGKTVTDGTVVWKCAGTLADRDYLLDTSGYTAVMEVRQGDYDGETQLEASTADGRITVGFTPPKWAVATAYGVGVQVVPPLLNGFVYQCVVAGTSHASTEPAWPTTLGATVLDNTARWRCEQAGTLDRGLVSNLVVFVPAAVTQDLVDWGRGVWTLQLIDSFGRVTLWVDGPAYLRQEATK